MYAPPYDHLLGLFLVQLFNISHCEQKVLIASVRNQCPEGQGSQSKNLMQLLPLNYIKGSELLGASRSVGNTPKWRLP